MNYKNIYFIGIGGIGMSAIARMLKSQGVKVSGSDSSQSEVTDGLISEGITVHIGESVGNIPDDVDCVVYTLAIPKENVELVELQNHVMEDGQKIPIYTYAQMLGKLSEGMETVAVAGTHGKTTVTAMIASGFSKTDLHPHVVIGSLISDPDQTVRDPKQNNVNKKTNYIKSGTLENGGNIFVTEACEYKRSFLNLNPKHVVITNIDIDHLDYYRDLKDIHEAFIELCEKIPQDGKIVCDPDLQNLKPIVEKFPEKIIDYKEFLNKVPKLKVLGDHNKLNAAAAMACVSLFVQDSGQKIEQDLKKISDGLSEFSGTWRRLENRGQFIKQNGELGSILYDDYAHHPDEISAGISALYKEFSDKKINIFFQPHLYSRTKTLGDDFIKVFVESLQEKKIGNLYVLPIYAAREKKDETISSEILVNKIIESYPKFENNVFYIENFQNAVDKIKLMNSGNVVVTVGAGDVYKILDLL
jgi:UDP-N-acetylmuramate--alanine ligase